MATKKRKTVCHKGAIIKSGKRKGKLKPGHKWAKGRKGCPLKVKAKAKAKSKGRK